MPEPAAPPAGPAPHPTPASGTPLPTLDLHQNRYTTAQHPALGIFLASASDDNTVKLWDVAPSKILVEEAGGRITHTDGGPLDLASPSTLASNGRIHAEMLEIMKTVKAAGPHQAPSA